MSECGLRTRFRSDDMAKVAAVILADNARSAEREARAALSKGADLEELRRLAKQHRPTIVASHEFATVTDPGRVQDALEACAAIGDVAKVAAPAEDLDSAIQLIDLARAQSKGKRQFVLIGTGIGGMI